MFLWFNIFSFLFIAFYLLLFIYNLGFTGSPENGGAEAKSDETGANQLFGQIIDRVSQQCERQKKFIQDTF
jgi:hypothetical protein